MGALIFLFNVVVEKSECGCVCVCVCVWEGDSLNHWGLVAANLSMTCTNVSEWNAVNNDNDNNNNNTVNVYRLYCFQFEIIDHLTLGSSKTYILFMLFSESKALSLFLALFTYRISIITHKNYILGINVLQIHNHNFKMKLENKIILILFGFFYS